MRSTGRFDRGNKRPVKAMPSPNETALTALQEIARAFASLKSLGPTSIASENRYPEPQERAIVQQGAFQRVQHLLKALNLATESFPK